MEVQKFIHPQFGEIRTMTMPDGQVGFVGKDVAEVLGYKLPRKAILDRVGRKVSSNIRTRILRN